MKLSQRILNMSWSALIAALLSFSMTATLSGAMGMSVSYVQIALFCL
ncbi:MAG: hypothetical protein IJJ23_07040 [Clostridia bacterium]|nr:hypothetical protein [Clostridia bacterium]